jgi:hypothetical protein
MLLRKAWERAETFAYEATEKAKPPAAKLRTRQNPSLGCMTKAKGAAAEANRKVEEDPFKYFKGVHGIVRQTEEPLHSVVEEAVESEKAVAPLPAGPRSLPDTQRPRESRPELLLLSSESDHRKDYTVVHRFLLVRTISRVLYRHFQKKPEPPSKAHPFPS